MIKLTGHIPINSLNVPTCTCFHLYILTYIRNHYIQIDNPWSERSEGSERSESVGHVPIHINTYLFTLTYIEYILMQRFPFIATDGFLNFASGCSQKHISGPLGVPKSSPKNLWISLGFLEVFVRKSIGFVGPQKWWFWDPKIMIFELLLIIYNNI